MNVGESFFVPEAMGTESMVRSAAYYFALRHKEFRFSVRKVKVPSTGTRVWRIEAKQGG